MPTGSSGAAAVRGPVTAPAGGAPGSPGPGGTPPGPAALRSDRAAVVARRVGLVALGALPAAALLVFFLYPVGSILALGLTGPHGLDLEAFASVAGRGRFLRIAWFTVWQAAASAAISVILGVPGAFLLYRRTFRGRAVARALATVPFVLPTVVVGLAFRTLFAPHGWLGGLGWRSEEHTSELQSRE